MRKYQDIISELIVTCLFVGKIKIAPGTWGSLAAFPIIYTIGYLIINTGFLIPIQGFSYVEQRFITIFVVLFIFIAILSIVGIIASNHYMSKNKVHDPGEIVIDEVVGQMLTCALTLISVVFVYNSKLGKIYNNSTIDLFCFFLLPFFLFRICDIIKPWPIRWVDNNVKGGLGVMLDDFVAAIMASVLQYAIIFTII